jgi:hypothetical protein
MASLPWFIAVDFYIDLSPYSSKAWWKRTIAETFSCTYSTTARDERGTIIVDSSVSHCGHMRRNTLSGLYAALIAVFPRLDVLNAIILSSIFFGIAHMYQGWKGVLATGFVGLLLAWFYYMTGSLLLPIIIHALIDLRAMFLFPQEKAST